MQNGLIRWYARLAPQNGELEKFGAFQLIRV